MQASPAQVQVLSNADAQHGIAVVYLHSLLEPSTLPSCRPSKYDTDVWQTLRPYLKSRGYRLITQRDAQLQMAKASKEPVPDQWNGPPKDDDTLYSATFNGAVFEGYRLSDNCRVMFKIIDTSDSYEATILSYLRLSETSVHRDPRNKTIPMLELLKISKERVIAVIELWSPYWSRPPVVTWAEFADFVYQVLEGLAYLHDHRIAHLDISDGNIVSGPLSAFIRTSDPRPPRSFAFIDFGLSVMYSSSDPGPFKTTGDVATHIAPEMSPTIEYDPFKVDIWQMGTLLTRAAKKREFEMMPLQEFLRAMTCDVPEDRPTARQALEAFATIEQDCRDLATGQS